MRFQWGGEFHACTQLNLLPGYINVGDFIIRNDELFEVITVQPHCPHIENLRHLFTMFTLRDRNGNIHPDPDVVGRQVVIRRKRTWKVVPA